MPYNDHWSTTYMETLGLKGFFPNQCFAFKKAVLERKRAYWQSPLNSLLHVFLLLPLPAVAWPLCALVGHPQFHLKAQSIGANLELKRDFTSSSSPLVARIGRDGCGSRTFTTPLSSPGISFTIPSVWGLQLPTSAIHMPNLIWLTTMAVLLVCPRGRCCHSLTHWSQIDFPAHRNSHPLPWHYFGGPDNEKYIEYTSK